MDELHTIDEIIVRQDQLTVQGARNMGLVLESIQRLSALRAKVAEDLQLISELREKLKTGENGGANDVQNQA